MSVGKCKRAAGFSEVDLEVYDANYDDTPDADKTLDANIALDAVELNIKNDYLSLVKTLKETGLALTPPPLRKPKAKVAAKKKKAKKAVAKEPTPEQMKAEDKKDIDALKETDAVKDITEEIAALPREARNKIRKGYVKAFGLDVETVWAIQNPDKLPVVDALTAQYVKDGMKGTDAFIKAVNETMLPEPDIKEQMMYRGRKGQGGTPRYPGTFYSTDRTVAEGYARTSTSEGKVYERDINPVKTLDIDAIANMPADERQAMLEDVTRYMEAKGVELEDSYMYDVLKPNGETDFAYPIQADSDFLLDRGYDSVKYENEGGVKQDGYFIPKREGDALLNSMKDKVVDPSTKDTLQSELVEEWGDSILTSNIKVLETFDDIPNDIKASLSDKVQAFIQTDNKGNSNIVLIADRISKGRGKNVVLHEKGVHELMSKHAGWGDVLTSVDRILNDNTHPDFELVNKARMQALRAYRSRPETNIEEETVAYIMNYGSMEYGFFKTIVRKVRQIIDDVLGVRMTTDDIIELARSMVQEQVDTNTVAEPMGTVQDTQLSEVTDNRTARIAAAKAKRAAKAPPTTPEEDKIIVENTAESKDKELITDFYQEPASNWIKQYDLSGGLKDTLDNIKRKGLGFLPNRPLLDMLDRVLPEGTKVSGVQDYYDTAEAVADERIEELDETLLKPFQKYQRSNSEEFQKLVKIMLNASRTQTKAEDNADYLTLSEEGKKFYDQSIEHYKMMRDDKFNSLRQYTSSLNIDEDKRADMMNVIDEMDTQANRDRVYVPFNRFGSFRVEGVDSFGRRYVSHHDTHREAKAAQKARKGWNLKVTKVDDNAASAKELFTAEAFDRANRFVEESGGNKVAQEMLWKTFLEYSPQKALKRKMARRKDISGMSLDFIRGLGQSVHRDIRLNERLKVKPEVDNIFSNVAKTIQGIEGDNVEALNLFHEIRQREVSDTRADWSKSVTKTNFGYYLGFNPASALINLTQNVIVALPVLSADYNAARVFKMMNQEFAHVVKNRGNETDFGYKGVERHAIQAMMKDGTVNVTQAHMMTGINEGHTADYNPGGSGDKFVNGMAYLFHNAEIVNRAVTAMTAFKLKMAETDDFNQSLAYAKEKTYESQFDFSETGKARYQRGDWGNVILAMKSYPINMSVYMARNFNRWLLDNQATPAESKAARAKVLGTLIVTSTIGGAGALPLSTGIAEVFGALFGDEDEDPHAMIKEGVYSIAGETLGDVILNGLVGSATGLDLQSKVSLGFDMFARIQGGQSAAEMKEAMVTGMFGPVGGIANNMVRGIDQINEGKVAEGVITMLPASLRNASKSVKNYSQGVALTSYDTYIEDFGEKDAVLKFLGFNSDEYAAYFEESGGKRRVEDKIKAEKAKLLRASSWAKKQGSYKEVVKSRKAIREYNRGRPTSERITQSTMDRHYEALQEKSKKPLTKG